MATLMERAQAYMDENRQRFIDQIVEMAKIPAPSNKEELRAEYCKKYMESFGAKGVYIDDALNVVYPYHAEGDDLVVIMGHSDIVFPDMTEIPVHIDGDKIHGPGVGDDTANAIAVMDMARFVTENNLKPKQGILFVIDAGEEGLGNLKGSRQILKDYAGRVKEVLAIDGGFKGICNDAVGSKRYNIKITTEGGHSYGAFGNRNAIFYASTLITTLYSLKVPAIGKTTYNVGIINGGTSVNTIAQKCEFMYEYRSDKKDALAIMDKMFEATIEAFKQYGIGVEVELLGDRPCSADFDNSALTNKVVEIAKKHGFEMHTHAGSTDCNVWLADAIPAVCFGVYEGRGAHTREEWISISSMDNGKPIFAEVVLSYFDEQ